jgi:ribosome modulation factor
MLSRDEIEQLMGEGAKAFEHGMSRDTCPYPITSAQFTTWLRGFQNAAFGAQQSSSPRSH